VITFLEVKHIVGFVKDIQGRKAGRKELGNLPDADSGDTVDIEAVNLPGQRRYLLKQGNTPDRRFGALN
jgi:hypothetical protein